MLSDVLAYFITFKNVQLWWIFLLICWEYCKLRPSFFFIEISCSTATSNLSPEKSSVSITQPVLLPRESSL